MCYGRQFTLNKDPLPEYSSDVCPSEEHQIRQDEHGGGESREEGEAASFIRCRNISLLGNKQKKPYMDAGESHKDLGQWSNKWNTAGPRH